LRLSATSLNLGSGLAAMVSEMWGDCQFAIPYHNSTGTPQPPRQMASIQALLVRFAGG
jgi:hypothetical protein